MYNVPVVFPSLRREESLLQIADSLGYLDQVFSDVHNRINGKVAEQSQALAGLNERILVATAKVARLKENKNKATNVFSVSKYPAEANGAGLSVLFSCTQSHDLENPSRSSKQGLTLARFYVPTEKDLGALHVHVASTMDELDRELRRKKRRPRKNNSSGRDAAAAEGADDEDDQKKKCRLSRTVDSVSSLLVFDNNDLVDQVAPRRAKKKAGEEERQQMDDAPTSILTGEQLDMIAAKNYLYVPGVAAVPEFDVPLSLPYLPDVATDVAYSAELPSIAPSAGIPELPAIQTAGEATAAASTAAAAAPPPPPCDDSAAAAVPPPPPPPAADSAGAQAPGPPPPPMAAPPSQTAAAPPPPSSGDDGGDGDGAGRGDLLASIRNAGGGLMKLKSAKERKLEKKKKDDDATPNCSTGGLFAIAALQAKLRMRREGISGKKRREDSDDTDTVSVNVKPTEDDEDWK